MHALQVQKSLDLSYYLKVLQSVFYTVEYIYAS